MENLEYIHWGAAVLACIFGFCIHYLTVFTKPLTGEHRVFEEKLSCIDTKLDSIIEKLAEQKVEVGILNTKVESLASRVSTLESWFGEILGKAHLTLKED